MAALAHHEAAPIQVIRDRGGILLGRVERQAATGRFIARDAAGLIVGSYDPREGTTRDKRGLVVARGDVLAALLLRR